MRYVGFDFIGNVFSLLEQILENSLTNYSPHCRVGHLGDEISNFAQVVAQLVDQLVGVYSPVVDCGVDPERHVIFGDNSLGLEIQHISFHIHGNDSLSPRVYYVEAGLDDLFVAAESLQNAHFAGFELVEGTSTAAAEAGAENFKGASAAAATFKTALVASSFVGIGLPIVLVVGPFLQFLVHVFDVIANDNSL